MVADRWEGRVVEGRGGGRALKVREGRRGRR